MSGIITPQRINDKIHEQAAQQNISEEDFNAFRENILNDILNKIIFEIGFEFTNLSDEEQDALIQERLDAYEY